MVDMMPLVASEVELTGAPPAWEPRELDENTINARPNPAYDPSRWDAEFLKQMAPGHTVSKDSAPREKHTREMHIRQVKHPKNPQGWF